MEKVNYTDLSRSAIIKQPTTYTLMPKKVTLTGLKVFAIVMTRLQGFFNDALEARHRRAGNSVQPAKQLYLDFIPKGKEFEIVSEDRKDISRGDVRFTIKFKELGIAPKNYPAAFQTLMKMAFTPVRIPIEGKITYTTLMRLDVEAGENAVLLPDGQMDYIKPEVSLVVPRIVANRIFDVELMGYDQYVLHTALYSKSIYTFLIYVFLSGQWFRGNLRIEKDYEEFRAEVGLYNDPTDPDEKRKRAGERYKAWGQFCQSVLEPAKKELDESCKTGHAPLSFTYEPIYGTRVNASTGRTTRIVTHILFTIIPAQGYERRLADSSTVAAENTKHDKLMRFLHDRLHLSHDQIKKAIAEVTDLAGMDGINQLAAKANFLYDYYVVKEKSKASNLGATCEKAIKDFIANELIRTPRAEIVTDPEEVQRAQDALAGISNERTPGPRPMTKEESAMWQNVFSEIEKDIKKGTFPDSEKTKLWKAPLVDVYVQTDGSQILRLKYDGFDIKGKDITSEAPLFLATLFASIQKHFGQQKNTAISAAAIFITNENGRPQQVAFRKIVNSAKS